LSGVSTDVGACAAPSTRVPELGSAARPGSDRFPGSSRYLIAAACAAVAISVAAAHGSVFDTPTVRASIESLIGLCGAGAVALMWSRFQVSHELRDLLLIAAASVFTIVNVVAFALPAALALRTGGWLSAAAPWGVLLAATGFSIATRVPARRLAPARGGLPQVAMLGGALAAACAAVLGIAFESQLAVTTHGSLTAILHRPLGDALALASAALLLSAAVTTWQSGSDGWATGERWIACGLGILGAAWLYSVTLPLLAPGALSSREPMRLAGAVMILGGAIIEERSARRAAARLAVIAERQRIARDLHDGIAQDLAFIAAHAGNLLGTAGAEHPLSTAARRALAVSRGVIDDLSDLDSRPIADALGVLAAELSDRFSMSVKIDVAHDPQLTSQARRDLVRIVREAVANAARHGAASHVMVTIDRSELGAVLRVCDDGSGIVKGDGRRAPEGFGVASMRERAAALGAKFTLRESPGGGTEVEVALP